MTAALAVGLAYLLGTFSLSWWIGQVDAGIDIREHGSGNAGATNVLRILGWKRALPVLAIDVAKGVLATWIPVWIDAEASRAWLVPACGAAAVAGHIWPVLHRFRGGRGVATTAGVLGVLHPPLLIAALGVFAVVLVWSRQVWTASIVAAVALGPLAWIFLRLVPSAPVSYWPGVLAIWGMAAAVIWAHRDRISEGIQGQGTGF